MGRHLRQDRSRPALTPTALIGPLLVVGVAAVLDSAIGSVPVPR